MPTSSPPRRPSRLGSALVAVVAATLLLLVPAGSAGADIRVSDNWQLRPDSNPIHGRDAIGMAVNPDDPRHVVAMYADWASLWCEVAVSFDGGRTWRRDRLEAPPGFVDPPCTVGGHLSSQSGQSIVFGRGDTVYTTFSSARVNEAGFEEGQTVLVSRSTDGGRTFGRAVVALSGGADPDRGPDYVTPKLAVVPGTGGSRDRLHLVAGETDPESADNVVFTTSTDDGRTWSPRKVLDDEGSAIEVSQPVIGRGGRLYVAWRTRKPGDRPGRYRPEGTVVVARSADRGRTWDLRGVAGVRGYVHDGPRQAPFTTVQTYTNSTFPRLAADTRSGAVYLVYNNGDRPTAPDQYRAADHFIHPDSDVWFQRSHNDGKDWSAAVRLNDTSMLTSEVTQTRQPYVAVAPNGRVDVVWNDRRHWYRGCLHTHNPCLETRLGDTYYAYSDDSGRSFSEDRRITDRSIGLDVGYDYRFATYWEYAPTLVHVGRHRLLVGWMDTRDGNFETDTQSLYLARVDHRPSGRAPERTVREDRASELAVELSQRAYPGGPEAVLGGTFATRPWTRVVIVNERDTAAVMAAGVLARAHIAPVLLAASDGLDAATRAEVVRMAPVGAFVIGSRKALSDDVVDDLAATGIAREEIVRITGRSRADTARRIAEATDRRTVAERERGHPAFDAAILVNPDDGGGYAAAVLAAARRLPVLHAGRDSVPAATREALAWLGIRKVLVVGDEDAVSDDAVAGLPGLQRLVGSDDLGTSRAVAGEARRRAVARNTVFAAAGPTEAALLGATGARIGGQLLLADRSEARRVVPRLGRDDDVDRVFVVRRGAGG